MFARVARGVRQDDLLFPADLGNGVCMPEMRLSLTMTLLGSNGEAGWTDRVLRLLEQEGPFRLTFLEMLLRAADERASGGDQ